MHVSHMQYNIRHAREYYKLRPLLVYMATTMHLNKTYQEWYKDLDCVLWDQEK